MQAQIGSKEDIENDWRRPQGRTKSTISKTCISPKLVIELQIIILMLLISISKCGWNFQSFACFCGALDKGRLYMSEKKTSSPTRCWLGIPEDDCSHWTLQSQKAFLH